jgi:hypothetical protein
MDKNCEDHSLCYFEIPRKVRTQLLTRSKVFHF